MMHAQLSKSGSDTTDMYNSTCCVQAVMQVQCSDRLFKLRLSCSCTAAVLLRKGARIGQCNELGSGFWH